MKKYDKEVQQAFLDNEKAVLKALEKEYKATLEDINDKIAMLLGRDDADLQNVVYQVEYQKALKAQVKASLEALQAKEFETVSQFLSHSYEEGFLGSMYAMQQQGVPLLFPVDQKQVVEAVQHETQLKSSLYKELGFDIKDLQKKIAGEISRGIAGGLSYGEMARNISNHSKLPLNRAMLIARTESHRIQAKATFDAQHKAKEKGADVVKQWDAALDGKTRDTHRAMDGQIQELDYPFESPGGKTAMYPGDFGDPAEDCNCRCAILQRARWNLDMDYTKWEEDSETVPESDGTQYVKIKADNYKEFKKKAEKSLKNVPKNGKIKLEELNETEKKAVLDYMSSKSYVVNEKLRTGAKLSDDEKEFVETLNKALDKMPSYEGNLQRSLYFYDNKALNTFMSNYKVGESITFKEFLSATKGKTYNPDGQVQIFIQDAKNGKDISSINEREQEVLYKNNSSFNVLNVAENDGTYYIRLGEKV